MTYKTHVMKISSINTDKDEVIAVHPENAKYNESSFVVKIEREKGNTYIVHYKDKSIMVVHKVSKAKGILIPNPTPCL